MSAHVEAKRAWHFAGKRVQKNLHGAHAANVASAVAKMSAEKLKQEKSLLQVVENKGKERRGRMQSEMVPHLPLFVEHTRAHLVSYDISPTGAINAIFKDNRTVCAAINERERAARALLSIAPPP